MTVERLKALVIIFDKLIVVHKSVFLSVIITSNISVIFKQNMLSSRLFKIPSSIKN